MQFDQLNRRELITLLSGTTIAWPLAARAQQPAMPVIGFLHLTSRDETRGYLPDFHQGLADAGYIEGKNVAIEYRWGEGHNDRLPSLIAELVRRQVSVIVTLESTLAALAAKEATRTIPVIFMQGADPVRIGIGFLHLTSQDDTRGYLPDFHKGLADVGYIEGKNVAIEYRWGEGQRHGRGRDREGLQGNCSGADGCTVCEC